MNTKQKNKLRDVGTDDEEGIEQPKTKDSTPGLDRGMHLPFPGGSQQTWFTTEYCDRNIQ